VTIAPIDSAYTTTPVSDLAQLGNRAQDSVSSDQRTNRTDQSSQANTQSNSDSNGTSKSTSNSKPIEDTVHLSTLPSQVQILTRQGETPQEVAAQLGLTVNIVDGELGVQASKLGTDALTVQPATIPTLNTATQAR